MEINTTLWLSNSTMFSSQTTPTQITQKQSLFEKPLTPSDVGKLNRLVIPKQYAERYFPIRGGCNISGESPENGLLLSFEDELGKTWRFRYSYWNSSQSYVLTKGWSRFVKEKKLDAGDVVLFERFRERMIIGWRRRSVHPAQDSGSSSSSSGGCGRWTRVLSNPTPLPYPTHSPHHGVSTPYLQSHDHFLHAGSNVENEMKGRGSYKTLRLFGVNMECHTDDYYHHTGASGAPATPDHNHHMDM